MRSFPVAHLLLLVAGSSCAADVQDAPLTTAPYDDEGVSVVASALGVSSTLGRVSDDLVVFDDTNAYYVERDPAATCGYVSKINMLSAVRSELVDTCFRPTFMQSDGGARLYYQTVESGANLRGADISGGQASPPIADRVVGYSYGQPYVDGHFLHYVDGVSGYIYRSDMRVAGARTRLAPGSQVLGADAARVYYVRYVAGDEYPYKLQSVPIAGGTPTLYSALKSSVPHFTQDANHFFYGYTYQGTAYIKRVHKTTRAYAQLYANSTRRLSGLRKGGTRLFASVVAADGTGEIIEQQNDGWIAVKSGLIQPSSLHLRSDGTGNLWWVDGTAGSRRIRKAGL